MTTRTDDYAGALGGAHRPAHVPQTEPRVFSYDGALAAADRRAPAPQSEARAISHRNAVAITGMSWQWDLKFARAHGVPIWRFGPRKQLIPVEPMLAAMARVGAQQAVREPMTERECIDEILHSVGLERVEP